jgi:hypothetical protein
MLFNAGSDRSIAIGQQVFIISFCNGLRGFTPQTPAIPVHCNNSREKFILFRPGVPVLTLWYGPCSPTGGHLEDVLVPKTWQSPIIPYLNSIIAIIYENIFLLFFFNSRLRQR